MAGVQGSDYIVEVSTDLTAPNLVEVECQGAATINLGKTANVTKYKNCSITTIDEEGFSFEFTMGQERPLSPGQTALWAAFDSQATVLVRIADQNTGGMSFEGPCKIAIQNIESGVDGPAASQVTIGEDGTIVRGTTT